MAKDSGSNLRIAFNTRRPPRKRPDSRRAQEIGPWARLRAAFNQLDWGRVSLAVITVVSLSALLSLHLLHGADSLFQTLGWRNHRWEHGLRIVVTLGCAAYFLGNLAIPGAAVLGLLR